MEPVHIESMESANWETSALVVAHPGHELRVYGWLARAHPFVSILTDGSGHGGRSRLHESADLLDGAGAERGSIFGRYTDVALYSALLEGDVTLFRDLASELAGDWIAHGVTMVAGDSIEGYNPSHDICRALIDSAVSIAFERGRSIVNFDFAVVGTPLPDPDLSVRLDDDAFAMKMRAARKYDAMRSEVENAIEKDGIDSFRCERFRLRERGSSLEPPELPPFYERHGEHQVAAGYYRHVVRYREHVAPVNDALLARGERLTCVR